MHLEDPAGKPGSEPGNWVKGELLSQTGAIPLSPQRAAQPGKPEVLVAAWVTTGVGLSVLMS